MTKVTLATSPLSPGDLPSSVGNVGSLAPASEGVVGTLGAAMDSGATVASQGITLAAPGLAQALASGAWVALFYQGYVQTVQLTAPAAQGATTLSVATQAGAAANPLFSYPIGTSLLAAPAAPSVVLGSVTGDNRYRLLHGNRFVCLGDSVSAGVGSSEPATGSTPINNGAGDQGGGNWFAVACAQSNGAMRYVYNASIPGNTTTMMLSRIGVVVALAQAGRIDACFIQASINDPANGLSVATSIANLTQIVAVLRSYAVEPILTTVQPNNTGPGTYHTQTVQLNAAILAFAAQNGIHCVDFYGPLVDPTTAGSYLSTMSETASPAVHPNALGHFTLGQAVWNAIKQFVPYTPPYLTCDGSDPNNLLPHGTFEVGAAGVPTGWGTGSTGTTPTWTLSAQSGIVGQVCTLGVGAVGKTWITKTVTSGFSVGDKMAFLGKLAATSGVVAAGGLITCYAQFVGANAGYQNFIEPFHAASFDITSPMEFYGEGVVPPGTTSIVIILQLQTTAAGVASVAFGQATLVDRTVIGVAA